MQFIKFCSIAAILLAQFACNSSEAQSNKSENKSNSAPKVIADKFSYPVGKTETLTEAKDKKDDWYNALDFGVNNHLGEDWNKNSGGNTDCGEAVFAVAGGTIVYAGNAGEGWGNVVIIEHNLPDGKKVQSLYGHFETITKSSGEVKKREQIGTIGNAGGKYWCHLHLELREEICPMWNKAGGGYDTNRQGWLDPSKFIDAHR